MASRWIILLCLTACLQPMDALGQNMGCAPNGLRSWGAEREVVSFQSSVVRGNQDSLRFQATLKSVNLFPRTVDHKPAFPIRQTANGKRRTHFGKRNTVNGKRLLTGTALLAVADVASIVGLSTLWYADYEQGSFHFHNDWQNWQQQDKLGHTAAAWQIARASASFAKWSGLNGRQAAIYGFATSTIYQSQIEVLDGFSERWGASPGDIAFNLIGALGGAYEGVADGPLPFTLKYSYHKSDNYDNSTSILGNLVKDYDGISHWLVLRPDLISPSLDWWPAWLGLSIGHSADGLTRAVSSAEEPHERIWMVGLDFDFLREIKVENPYLRGFLKTFSFVRIPAPALQFGRKVKFRPLYF